ncbi:MAG TPA: 5'-nucleosidase [Steroidobacteraceae bacterium]|jgi:adenosylhomocysteine nucleosidase|nr:5'-nucleosidase [Steroidobacteraceae bacterium]
MHPSKLLIVMALPRESRGLLESAGADLLYTGVGKVNAAAALTRRLTEIRCRGEALPLVVNMGTAGSRSIPAHRLVAATRFAQRDMDVSGLGFAPGVTPFDATPAVLEFPRVFAHLPPVLCSTADSFATHLHEVSGDVVDMEAFALARVCHAENARFACVKYVTDGADGNSATHWEAALDNAARAFATAYETLIALP